MAIVQSFGALKSSASSSRTPTVTSATQDLSSRATVYAEIYKRQPAVRTCVDFLARNIADLTLHAYRRKGDTDRERLAGHDVERWLADPNPSTTRYRLQETLMGDLGIYFNHYLLKVRHQNDRGEYMVGQVRLPPEEVQIIGSRLRDGYLWTVDGVSQRLSVDDVVYFGGYNPCGSLMGLSPMETLRSLLAQESAAAESREAFWRNAARVDGVVTRPLAAKRYDKDQVKLWREQWQATYAGGAASGKTVLLQDGETFQATSQSAKDAEYISARKLSREEVAAAYHIPLPLVGILEHATFSNIKEQHKHLYQDCLGPWLKMITEEWTKQLLSESADTDLVYLEYNIAEKLKGSFEEQAQSFQTLVGRPVMTINEGRARLNLPRDPDPESDRIAPQQGGPSDASVFGRTPPPRPVDDAQGQALAAVLYANRTRQQQHLRHVPIAERSSVFYTALPRWMRELTADLTPIVGAADAARRALDACTQMLVELEAAEETAA